MSLAEAEVPMRAIALFALLLSAAPALAQDTASFRSPTGNIHCMILTRGDAEARCDLREATPSFAPPADCEQDYGYAFVVGSVGPGRPICAGDTVFMPGSPVLAYGQSVMLGGFTCLSERTGMTCVNARGHGFSLARAQQRVF